MTIVNNLTNLPKEFDSFNSLPKDLKHVVFSFLELPDQNALARTSRTAYNTLNDHFTILNNIKDVLSPLKLYYKGLYESKLMVLEQYDEDNQAFKSKEILKKEILDIRETAMKAQEAFAKYFSTTENFEETLAISPKPTFANAIELSKKLFAFTTAQDYYLDHAAPMIAPVSAYARYYQQDYSFITEGKKSFIKSENFEKTVSLNETTILRKKAFLYSHCLQKLKELSKEHEDYAQIIVPELIELTEKNHPAIIASFNNFIEVNKKIFTDLDNINVLDFSVRLSLHLSRSFGVPHNEYVQYILLPIIEAYSSEKLFLDLTNLHNIQLGDGFLSTFREHWKLLITPCFHKNIMHLILDKFNEKQRISFLNISLDYYSGIVINMNPEYRNIFCRMINKSFKTLAEKKEFFFTILDRRSLTFSPDFMKFLHDEFLDAIINDEQISLTTSQQHYILHIFFNVNKEKFYKILDSMPSDERNKFLFSESDNLPSFIRFFADLLLPLIEMRPHHINYHSIDELFNSINELFNRYCDKQFKVMFIQHLLKNVPEAIKRGINPKRFTNCSSLYQTLKYSVPQSLEGFLFIVKHGSTQDIENYYNRCREITSDEELKNLLCRNIELVKTDGEKAIFVLNLINVKTFSREEKTQIVEKLPCLRTLKINGIMIGKMNQNQLLLTILMYNLNNTHSIRGSYVTFDRLLPHIPDQDILNMLVNDDRELAKDFLLSFNKKTKRPIYQVLINKKPELWTILESMDGFEYLKDVESSRKRDRENPVETESGDERLFKKFRSNPEEE